jgi:hypothetical protein
MNGSVQAINIVFDGPPAHEGGRFVEVETDDGHSMSIGHWLERLETAAGRSASRTCTQGRPARSTRTARHRPV